MTIRSIDPANERSSGVLQQLQDRVAEATAEHGQSLAGFALVTWDMCGDIRSAYEADNGPVRMALMPAIVHDALNGHVAVVPSQAAADYSRQS